MKWFQGATKAATNSLWGASLSAETRKALIDGIKKATWFLRRRKLNCMGDAELIAVAKKYEYRSDALRELSARAEREIYAKQVAFREMLQNIQRSSSPYSSGTSDRAMCSS